MKKIVFLPFLNDDSGKKWRERLELAFLNNDGGLTEIINDIRDLKDELTVEDYYKVLHMVKSIRQRNWLDCLIKETAALFAYRLNNLSNAEKDSNQTTIVAALPEFFWYDINDNLKHQDFDAPKYIRGYHKPLYDRNFNNYLIKTVNNELAKLTNAHKNLIIFAGTAMWKVINEENHKDEVIKNSLIIYHSGECMMVWGKHNISDIDGFGDEDDGIKDKRGEAKETFAPVIDFNGHKFAFDICLDFTSGKVPDENKQTALSTELCNLHGENPNVNVLIASGLRVDVNKIKNIKSNILLRCDGSYTPYGEILIKNDFGRKIDNVGNSPFIGTFYYDPNENDEA
jgi:hypothetical protein